MPYSTVADLPQAVRDRFKDRPKKLRQWMHTWNSIYDQYHDESRAFAGANSVTGKLAKSAKEPRETDGGFNFFIPLSKIDKANHTVSGYASTACVDLDGEIVSQDALKTAWPEYWKWRNIREMHAPKAVGVAHEASFDERGLYLTAKIVDNDAWQKCLEGVYKGFSIGGRKLAKAGNTITKLGLTEISVVDRPANPECSFVVNKSIDPDASGYLLPENADDMSEGPPEREPDNDYDDASEVREQVEGDAGPTDSRQKKIAKLEKQLRKLKKKLRKREFSSKERTGLADEGKALPDGSFPIENGGDLRNAIQAIGRAKDPEKAKAHIKSRARALGMTDSLPDSWSKLLKGKKKSASTPPSLTLDAEGGAEAALSKIGLSHAVDLEEWSAPDGTYLGEGGITTHEILDEDLAKGLQMDPKGELSLDDLAKAVAGQLLGKPNTPATPVDPTLVLVKAAQDKTKDMKDCEDEAEKTVKALFAVHKRALDELGKTSKSSGFDHAAALDGLKRIYDNLRTIRKAAKVVKQNLNKAAGRISGEGVVEQGISGVYEVPQGVTTISPSEMDNLPAHKAAQMVTKEHAETLAKLAAAEAEVTLLKSLPAAPVHGRRPYAFDVSKIGGQGGKPSEAFLKGINPADLQSEDQPTRESAVAKVIGNRILEGGGQSMFDPRFHGSAGVGNNTPAN